MPLPAYVIENMDADVKTVLSNIHEQASLQRTSMAGARDKAIAVVTSESGANMKDKAKEQEKKNIADDGKDSRGGDKKMDTDVSQGIYVTMTHNIAIHRIHRNHCWEGSLISPIYPEDKLQYDFIPYLQLGSKYRENLQNYTLFLGGQNPELFKLGLPDSLS